MANTATATLLPAAQNFIGSVVPWDQKTCPFCGTTKHGVYGCGWKGNFGFVNNICEVTMTGICKNIPAAAPPAPATVSNNPNEKQVGTHPVNPAAAVVKHRGPHKCSCTMAGPNGILVKGCQCGGI